MADLGRARYSREQPGTVLKKSIMFLKNGRLEDIKYDTERSLVDHLGTTNRPLVEHYFNH